MSVLGVLTLLIVSAVCAWVAEALEPGTIPGGFLASVLVGIVGTWSGTALFGHIGPLIAGVAVVPATACAAILIFALYLISRLLKVEEFSS